ncbi:hypothetical protein LCGC14_2479920 [marine sediment metagenome]|uniref:Uncharacterized protein n=1 Tax=marine sediment metagenome TaxID=412755 RepID=A0A0F9DJY2_9ZZZZ
MKASERDKLAQETHQALLGISGTADKGLVGDVKEIATELKKVNGRLTVVETKQGERSRPDKKAIGAATSVIVAVVIALVRAFSNN